MHVNPECDTEILESIVASVVGTSDFSGLQRIPCHNQDGWDAMIQNVSNKLRDYGHTVNIPPVSALPSNYPVPIGSIRSIGSIGSIGPIGSIGLEPLIMSLATRFHRMYENSDTEDENEDDDGSFKKLLEQTDVKEIEALIIKITSQFELPLGEKDRQKMEKFFQKIPLNFPHRKLIIEQSLKCLNLAPSEFKRTPEQSSGFIKMSLKLYPDLKDKTCGICQSSLDEVSVKLDDKYLICSSSCQHFFCFDCYLQLQQTLAGERCPVCRADLGSKEDKVKTGGRAATLHPPA